MPNGIAQKLCPGCKQELELRCFRERPGYPGKLMSWCNACTSRAAKRTPEQIRQRYRDHAVRYKAAMVRYRLRNPKASLISQAKIRAKKAGIPFGITESDFSIPSACPVLGISIQPNPSGRGPWAHSPSLDQIKPAAGYVPGNVRVISHRANTLKSNGTMAEFRMIMDDLARQAIT